MKISKTIVYDNPDDKRTYIKSVIGEILEKLSIRYGILFCNKYR